MEKEVANKFFEGCVFFDAETGFTLDVSGFQYMDSMDSLEKEYAAKVEEAVEFVGRMERGDIVNHTEVKEESEDRAVDHYNLRMKEELVPGKSLAASIKLWEHIKSRVDAVQGGETPMFTDVIFNGIGGSFLGPLMLVVAILGQDFNLCYPKRLRQRIHFVANTDADSFANVFSHVDLKKTLMVHMSKSGSTAETKGNLEAFNDLLVKNGIENPGSHNMAITVQGSYLEGFAKEKGFLDVFPMNVETGGRTSVCSAIGMVPAAFAQIDFAEFLRGQSYMDELTRKHTLHENPAMLIASLIDRMTNDLGKKNMIILGYSDSIKEFSHYLQQLYMESLGKEYSWDGVAHAEGQTVFGGVGTGEQHAFMQQVQKGIADCFVRFVYFRKRKHDFANGKAGSMGRQMMGFVRGTQLALTSNGRSYISQVAEECNMFTMGMLVALEERIVTFLAIFNEINAYDQPGVQDGKLAADGMNALGKKVCEYIEKTVVEDGIPLYSSALDLAKMNGWDPISVDWILSDLEANLELPNAYASLRGRITVSRVFQDGMFVYDIHRV